MYGSILDALEAGRMRTTSAVTAGVGAASGRR